jgi:hypothetical protein
MERRVLSPRHSGSIVAPQRRKIGDVQVSWTDVDRILFYVNHRLRSGSGVTPKAFLASSHRVGSFPRQEHALDEYRIEPTLAIKQTGPLPFKVLLTPRIQRLGALLRHNAA